MKMTKMIVPLITLILCACSSKQTIQANQPIDTLKKVDTTKPEPFIKRFGVGGNDFGGWLEFEEKGSYFKPAKRQHPDSAMIYMYRTNSRWSQQEVMPASIFLNGQRIRSLINNHYYWIEIPAGTYRMAIRRPLPPVYFQKGTLLDFQVEAGKTYYLKYAEEYHIAPPDKSLGLLFKRPIMQMPEKLALKELSGTRLKTQGYTFIDNPNFVTGYQLAPANGKPMSLVKSDRVSKNINNQVKVKFKYYNPITW